MCDREPGKFVEPNAFWKISLAESCYLPGYLNFKTSPMHLSRYEIFAESDSRKISITGMSRILFCKGLTECSEGRVTEMVPKMF